VSEATSHIFICFSSKDEALAREIVDFLETEGLKCWISSRDVPPGHNYQERIVQALEEARGIVFLFSEFSSRSGEIKKELSIGGSLDRPVFPLRLSPITPSGALRYELATRQWIDFFPDRQHALVRLADAIKRDFAARQWAGNDASPAEPVATAPPRLGRSPQPSPKEPARMRAAAVAPIVAPGSQQFEAIRALLARHIGPIAKVYVEKAANEARTADEFCQQLAIHVAKPDDRTSFVRAVRARLADNP
jgi:TIR domain